MLDEVFFEFRRSGGSGVWHWCRGCSGMPPEAGGSSGVQRLFLEPGDLPASGTLCPECLERTDRGCCDVLMAAPASQRRAERVERAGP